MNYIGIVGWSNFLFWLISLFGMLIFKKIDMQFFKLFKNLYFATVTISIILSLILLINFIFKF